MIIKAVKLYRDGFMTQPFAFGGEGQDGLDASVRYRSSLQNYVIDTGNEVILVDTGIPREVPETIPDEKTAIYMGHIIEDYVSALRRAGYQPEQVSKILITHKHGDHTGELRNFPNAKIYASFAETQTNELKPYPNVIPVSFDDGPYHNFPKSQKICDGVFFIEAKGHTLGNSIVIAEDNGLFYMLHGDVTYTDEALYQNKLSVVFDDVTLARETLDRVRQFVSENPTVYLSTHTPLGYENLENKSIIDLNNPPAVIPPADEHFVKTASGKYVCTICGYVYDPAVGDPSQGIPAGTPFDKLPSDWHCPRCKQSKSKFNPA